MDVVLVAGLWLDASVWDEVVAALEDRGVRAVAVRLPGQGDGDASATLDDQVAAVVAAVDAAATTTGGPVVVVGHSAACALVWAAADARPPKVARAVMIGGFPVSDGETYADFFPVIDGSMPFPGWDPFEGPDSADLDEAARQAFTAAAVPVPEGVSRGLVHLTDPARHQVPVTLVCPELSPEQARDWVEAGDLPELARVEHLSYVDLDSGHWPMISAPGELARVLSDVVEASAPWTVRPLDASTWDAFDELVERNNGVFGGCWCIGFHPERDQRGLDHRAAKKERVLDDRAHAALVLDAAGVAQGWCQWGSPEELSSIKHRRRYEQDAPPRPDWRITCFYVDTRHRGRGVARVALAGAIGQIARAGGGLVEAVPEVTAGRQAHGRFLYSATVELFEDHGFERVRQVGKHAWIVSRVVEPA